MRIHDMVQQLDFNSPCISAFESLYTGNIIILNIPFSKILNKVYTLRNFQFLNEVAYKKNPFLKRSS